METQAILFKNDKWTTNSARNWLKKNKYKAIKRVDKTENLLRYRIVEPKLFNQKSFRTIKLGKGILMVVGKKL